MLNNEIKEMHERWFEKAKQYGDSPADNFDKFFTLFVSYNILYTEATKILVSERKAKLNRYGGVPDSDGATKNIVKYLGCDFLTSELLNDPEVKQAIQQLNNVIPSRFDIKNKEWDGKKMNAINSGTNNRAGKAILELIYGVRCNMFHGQKNYSSIQTEILNPCIIILRKVNSLVFCKLCES